MTCNMNFEFQIPLHVQKRIHRNHIDEKIYTPNTFPMQREKDISVNIGFFPRERRKLE